MKHREIKFRGWAKYYNNPHKMYYYPSWTTIDGYDTLVFSEPPHTYYDNSDCAEDMIIMQYIGLSDEDDKDIYVGDILEFDNGDRIKIMMEEWLEVFCEPIGEPECEDQWRDLYRIEIAKVIGNIYENPELDEKD